MTLSRAKWPPTQCNQTNQADKLKAKDHRLFTITFSWTKNTHRVTWCKFVALQILHQSSWEKQSLKVNTTNPHSSSIYQNHILMTKTPGPKKTSTIFQTLPTASQRPKPTNFEPHLQDIEPSGGIPTELTMYQQIHSARMMPLMLQDQLSRCSWVMPPGGFVVSWFRGGEELHWWYKSDEIVRNCLKDARMNGRSWNDLRYIYCI